jgi:hypothetical protein
MPIGSRHEEESNVLNHPCRCGSGGMTLCRMFWQPNEKSAFGNPGSLHRSTERVRHNGFQSERLCGANIPIT